VSEDASEDAPVIIQLIPSAFLNIAAATMTLRVFGSYVDNPRNDNNEGEYL